MIFHAANSHEISCLICYFLKSSKILIFRLLQNVGGALRANVILEDHYPFTTQRSDFEDVFWHDDCTCHDTLNPKHVQWLPDLTSSWPRKCHDNRSDF